MPGRRTATDGGFKGKPRSGIMEKIMPLPVAREPIAARRAYEEQGH